MSTYANIDAFITKHLVLDLTADFDSRTLLGTAELMFERRDSRATEVVLDTRDLQVRKAEASSGGASWVDAAFRLDPATAAFGSALRVTVPRDADRLRITYASSPAAKGLQWLTPPQTSGKKLPFLFSQAQAIQARSFIPIQDTPAVRMTYDATIHVPKELVAVMAAEAVPGEKGSGVFHFRMPQPIPSYLIAIAIGDLTFQPMSDRTGVWAEPAAIAAAAKEFEDTEQMIKTTEALYGPYRWGRYDLLVLPPSFPFGGMPNVSLLPGERDIRVDDIIADTNRGVLIRNRGSWSIDHQRYNFQFSGQAFYEVRDGKITGMLRDVAYQANTLTFWKSMDMIGGKSSYWLGGAFNDGKGEPSQINSVSHGCVPARFRGVNILNTARSA